MPTKDLFHELDISVPTYAGAGPQISCTDTAAINAQFATAMDTSGYESNIIVLYFSDISNVIDYTFQMFESNTRATDAGTAVAATDVIVRRDDNTNTECPAATGILTTTGATSENHFYIFEYLGNMRWVQLTVGGAVGTADCTPGMMWLQGHPRHGPIHI